MFYTNLHSTNEPWLKVVNFQGLQIENFFLIFGMFSKIFQNLYEFFEFFFGILFWPKIFQNSKILFLNPGLCLNTKYSPLPIASTLHVNTYFCGLLCQSDFRNSPNFAKFNYYILTMTCRILN